MQEYQLETNRHASLRRYQPWVISWHDDEDFIALGNKFWAEGKIVSAVSVCHDARCSEQVTLFHGEKMPNRKPNLLSQILRRHGDEITKFLQILRSWIRQIMIIHFDVYDMFSSIMYSLHGSK